MKKIDCIMEYYLGNKANLFFLMGLIYQNNEHSHYILEPHYMSGAKVGCVANIFLAIKEDIVENKGELVYESKLFVNELEKTVSSIAKKDGTGYKIDNHHFDSASALVATLRNKIAHGNYTIDFDNNKVVISINANEVKIDIDKFALFVIMALQKALRSIKQKEYKRNVVLFKIKERNRKAPLKLKSEVKNIIRNFKNIDFTLKAKDGSIISDDIISLFEIFLSHYKRSQNPEILKKLRLFLNKNNIELQMSESSLKDEKDIDNLTNLTMTAIIHNPIYEDQIKMIGIEIQRLIDNKYNNFNPILSNLSNLCLLNAIEKAHSTETEQFKNYLHEGMYYLNYDNLAAIAIALFNTLFSYSFDDLYKCTTEYTTLQLDGFDYSKLDLSMIKVQQIELDVNVLEAIKQKNNGLLKKVAEINEKREKTVNNLNQVTAKNNAKAMQILTTAITDIDSLLSTLNANLQASNQELNDATIFFNSNQKYLRNKAIIEGIRNSIAHGHYEVLSGASTEETRIVFNDIYEGELTFKCEVKLMDFIDLLDMNAEVVNEFLESKKDKEKH